MDLQTADQRIAMLQQQLNSYQKPTLPQQTESMEAMISRLIEEKLSKLTESNVPQPVQPMDYGSQLLVAVGCALNEEQQLWLSEEKNRIDIPKYLASTEGQAITRRFFSSYKLYKETQCK